MLAGTLRRAEAGGPRGDDFASPIYVVKPITMRGQVSRGIAATRTTGHQQPEREWEV